jgi:2-octaprenyl-6-methoxyphenol hydroxylase
MAPEPPDHDIVIVGGGPVGSALALGLADAERSVLLIDATTEAGSDDPRTLALSYGSRLILERLAVWGAITPTTDIRTIHISQRGAFGSTVLTASEAQAPALGYVVPFSAVQRALKVSMQRVPRLHIVRDARANHIEEQPDRLLVTFEYDGRSRTVSTALLVIADGGTLARQLARVKVHDYEQSAVVCNVTTSKPHTYTAFERFTEDGPLALLPRENGYAVIWTVAPERAPQLCSATPAAFIEQLQSAFGTRAGRFLSVHDRATFPLALRLASDAQADRVVLIGNAAQTLHPVAGQGLNLGLRDAWELASLLCATEGDAGAQSVVHGFQRARQRDRRSSVLLTDAMVRAFSNRNLALQWLRGCGLTFLDCLPPAKQSFMRQMIFGALW